MNQILSTENSYKPKNNGGNNLLDMRKIIIIFSVLIIVFAVVIVGAKIYGSIKNKSDGGIIDVLNKPTISISKVENKCSITVKYDEGINKISYWWNEDEIITEKNWNGGSEFFTTIEIPTGDYNELHVKATGMDGSLNEVNQVFATENSQDNDPNKPKISLYFDENTKNITVVVTSAKGIREVVYSWDDEEEVKISPDTVGQKELRFEIEAERGTKTLKIKATDIEGTEQTKEQLTWAIQEPTLDIVINHGNILSIDVSHDKGFKKVIININGQELVYDENYPGYSEYATHLNLNIEVPNGHLTVDIKAYTLEAPEREKAWHREADIQV